MIKAEHSNIADYFFRIYIKRSLKKHFFAFHLLGDIPEIKNDLPLLLLSNHSTWWDGFFLYILNKKILKRSAYLMMLEDQLSRNLFFRRLGAYSVKQKSISSVKETLNYTIEILRKNSKPSPVVFFFPQGILVPWKSRPVKFKKGIEFIIDRINTPLNVCLLGIKAEFLNEQRPEVFFLFGKNQIVNKTININSENLGKELEILLDNIEQRILSGDLGETIFKGRRSINDVYFKMRTKVFRRHFSLERDS